MNESLTYKRISCSNCGADLLFDPSTQTNVCNFCGSSFQIEKATDAELVIPDGIVPFKVDKKQYNTALITWLSEGDFTPDDILHYTKLNDINGVYLPMYFFSGSYHANWSASSGYNRREKYYERNSKGEVVEKFQIVTDWRPSSGQVSHEFTVLGFAGELKNIRSEIANFSESTIFKNSELKSFNNRYILGFSLLEFHKNENEVWTSSGAPKIKLLVDDHVKGRIPGDTNKDLSYDIRFDFNRTLKIFIPNWIVYYKYKSEFFYTCIDGCNISRIAGTKPVDKKRLNKVRRSYIPALITSGFFLLLLICAPDSEFFNNYFGYVLLAIGVFLIFGIILHLKIIGKSMQKREKILTKFLSGEKSLEVDNQDSPTDENNKITTEDLSIQETVKKESKVTAFNSTPKNGMALASLLLGIISIFSGFTFIIPILAIVFGVIGLSKAKNMNGFGKKKAIVGIIMGSFLLITWLIFLTGVEKSLDDEGNKQDLKNLAANMVNITNDGILVLKITNLESGFMLTNKITIQKKDIAEIEGISPLVPPDLSQHDNIISINYKFADNTETEKKSEYEISIKIDGKSTNWQTNAVTSAIIGDDKFLYLNCRIISYK